MQLPTQDCPQVTWEDSPKKFKLVLVESKKKAKREKKSKKSTRKYDASGIKASF